MADALGVPVAVQATAGEGGPWGMAILAAYMANRGHFCGLQQFLTDVAFQAAKSVWKRQPPPGRKILNSTWKHGKTVWRWRGPPCSIPQRKEGKN